MKIEKRTWILDVEKEEKKASNLTQKMGAQKNLEGDKTSTIVSFSELAF